jgi:hypothetical protein
MAFDIGKRLTESAITIAVRKDLMRIR